MPPAFSKSQKIVGRHEKSLGACRTEAANFLTTTVGEEEAEARKGFPILNLLAIKEVEAPEPCLATALATSEAEAGLLKAIRTPAKAIGEAIAVNVIKRTCFFSSPTAAAMALSLSAMEVPMSNTAVGVASPMGMPPEATIAIRETHIATISITGRQESREIMAALRKAQNEKERRRDAEGKTIPTVSTAAKGKKAKRTPPVPKRITIFSNSCMAARSPINVFCMALQVEENVTKRHEQKIKAVYSD